MRANVMDEKKTQRKLICSGLSGLRISLASSALSPTSHQTRSTVAIGPLLLVGVN